MVEHILVDLANAYVLALRRLLADGDNLTANLGTGFSVAQVVASVTGMRLISERYLISIRQYPLTDTQPWLTPNRQPFTVPFKIQKPHF